MSCPRIPEDALVQLTTSTPLQLDALPETPGLYALYDHEGQIRYLGMAAKDLRDRIFRRHVGGDDNSHKFSSAYNAGRMWHDRKHPVSDPLDGKIAKQLRREFAKATCQAAVLRLPNWSTEELFRLEEDIRALAPREMQIWNDRRQLHPSEPTAALNAFLKELKWPDDKIAAINRQAERWEATLST